MIEKQKVMNKNSINRTFRKADIQRWQSLDFVVGYEIHQSNNPSKECIICQHLTGKYPVSFLWDGWDDRCKCFATPILQDEESFDEQELSDLKAALWGTEHKKYAAKNKVLFVPENFIDWFMENREHFNKTNTIPDFVTKNIKLIISSYEHYNSKN